MNRLNLGLGSFVALLAVLFVASSASAQEKKKLPLKLEKGQTHSFQVEWSGDPMMQGGVGAEGRSGTLGEERKSQQNAQNPQNPQTRETPGATGGHSSGMAQRQFEYKIEVKDASRSGDATLEVTVNRSMGTGAGAGANPPRTGLEDSSRGTGAGNQLVKFTAKVDQDGKVKQVTGLENWTGFEGTSGSSTGQSREGASREPGSERSEGGAQSRGDTGSRTEGSSQYGKEGKAGHHAKMVVSQLQVILGAGLHQVELQEGKTYSGICQVQAPIGTTGGRSGASESGRSESGRSESGRTEEGARSGGATSGTWKEGSHGLHALLLRYDGPSQMVGKEVAKFTVLLADAGAAGTSPSTGRTGELRPISQSPDEQNQQPGREAGQSTTGKQVGDCYFRFDDGLVERFTAEFRGTGASVQTPGAGTGAGAGASATAGMAFRVTIRRSETANR